MKSFIASLIIAVIIVSGTVFYTHRIELVSEKLAEDNQKIISLIEKDDFDSASEFTKDMADYVDKKKIALAIIMDHSDLDKIETSIAELQGYIEGKVKTDSVAKCNTLDVMIRHMPKNYKLKIENIL